MPLEAKLERMGKMKYIWAVLFTIPSYVVMVYAIYLAYEAMLQFVQRDRWEFVFFAFFAYLFFILARGWEKGVVKALGLEQERGA